jgi:hypothetical protein
MSTFAHNSSNVSGNAAQLRIDDLERGVSELADDEIRAISGGLAPQWPVSWTCGSSHSADEWAKP